MIITVGLGCGVGPVVGVGLGCRLGWGVGVGLGLAGRVGRRTGYDLKVGVGVGAGPGVGVGCCAVRWGVSVAVEML